MISRHLNSTQLNSTQEVRLTSDDATRNKVVLELLSEAQESDGKADNVNVPNLKSYRAVYKQDAENYRKAADEVNIGHLTLNSISFLKTSQAGKNILKQLGLSPTH